MKLLIYGHKGWIGQQFLEIVKNCKDANFTYLLGNVRVDNELELEKEIADYLPTHIVSFIGRTHGTYKNKKYTTIDYLEQKGCLTENIRDNLYAPMILSILSKKYNYHYTYLGTGCIFNFDETHKMPDDKNKKVKGFNEYDKPNFFGSSYSIVKGFTDRLMHHIEGNVLNIRIRMPISSEVNPRNFITKITNYEKICSCPNSMTVLDECLPILFQLMKQKTLGTVNLTNPGAITHNEILKMYKEIVNPEFTWKNFTYDEQMEILASDRSNNFLKTGRIELLSSITNIHDSVRNILMKMKSNIDLENKKNN
jgi:dTDP-4-dehydrorhamnose reductase